MQAGNHNKDRIIEILTNSFDDNKSTNWVVKNDKHRVSRIQKLMLYAYDLCEKQNGTHISDDQNGAVIYDYPVTSKYTLVRLLKDISFIFNVIGPERLIKVLKREGYIKKHHPKENFIYLWFLGVSSEHQGKGTGSKLLSELVDVADKKKLSIYLETSNPRNLELYKRFGFSIYHEWNTDFIGFSIWFMRRDSKKSQLFF